MSIIAWKKSRVVCSAVSIYMHKRTALILSCICILCRVNWMSYPIWDITSRQIWDVLGTQSQCVLSYSSFGTSRPITMMSKYYLPETKTVVVCLQCARVCVWAYAHTILYICWYAYVHTFVLHTYLYHLKH